MTKRETVLAAVVAGFVALMVVRWGYLRIDDLFGQRERRLQAIQQNVRDRETLIRSREGAAAQLAEWQRRSLPAKPGVALGLYKEWLHQLLTKSELKDVHVTSLPSRVLQKSNRQLSLSVRCQGTNEQFVKFLYSFYHADHLHKIRTMTLLPTKDAKLLDLQFAVEALVLPGADHIDTLSTTPAQRLARDQLQDYVAAIVDRNLFAKHEAKKADAGDASSKAADAKLAGKNGESATHIFFTSLMDSGEEPQVWLDDRKSGRVFILRSGEQFKVDGFQGTVTAIRVRPREVVIATEGKQIRVALGHNLSQGTELTTPQG